VTGDRDRTADVNAADVNRDRDRSGRPRNARPRDGLGRPLPRGGSGEDTMPDDLAVTGTQAAELADQLLRAGRPFHAHEVLEAAWKTGPAAERDLWQGLAQIAVGLTHAHRGNARGAVTLLRRGAARVRGYAAAAEGGRWVAEGDRGSGAAEGGHGDAAGAGAGSESGEPRPFGINVGEVVTAAEDLAARIEQNGLAAVAAPDLNPGLLG
jgi:uncharacterized protein